MIDAAYEKNVFGPNGPPGFLATKVDQGVPKPLFHLAAALELADRAHFRNDKPNLDEVLWQGAK